jgi:hypothetical protein
MSPAKFAVGPLGLVDLYDWQLLALEAAGQGLPTAICAANGSGKTKRVIASLVLWFLTSFPRGVCKTTSGSWQQIEEQLMPELESYHDRFPNWQWLDCMIRTGQGRVFQRTLNQ